MTVREVARISHIPFVISRLWRDGKVSIPTSDTQLQEGDRLLIVTTEQNAETLTALFGEQEQTDWNKEDVDWNAIDSRLISQSIVITRPEINGKALGALRLRNSYGINISAECCRSGVNAARHSRASCLQLGDRADRLSAKRRSSGKCREGARQHGQRAPRPQPRRHIHRPCAGTAARGACLSSCPASALRCVWVLPADRLS